MVLGRASNRGCRLSQVPSWRSQHRSRRVNALMSAHPVVGRPLPASLWADPRASLPLRVPSSPLPGTRQALPAAHVRVPRTCSGLPATFMARRRSHPGDRTRSSPVPGLSPGHQAPPSPLRQGSNRCRRLRCCSGDPERGSSRGFWSEGESPTGSARNASAAALPRCTGWQRGCGQRPGLAARAPPGCPRPG